MSPKRLFVIDGTALAYRSYFALQDRPLINSKGLNTSAIFGFTQSLLRLIDTEKPDYLAIAFDSRQPSFRHQLDANYKATREKMPEELADQLSYIEKISQYLAIPFLVAPGYEADDIIATLVTQYHSSELNCFIVSGDKDFTQLLNQHIFLYAAGKQKEPPTIMDSAAVIKRYGVTPAQMRDWLTLTGDNSDNVPGLPGVGAKTATQLLQKHGSIQHLLEMASQQQIDNVKLNDKLLTHRQQLLRSQELIKLITDLPIATTLQQMLPHSWHHQALAELFAELEFRTLEGKMRSLAIQAPTTATPAVEKNSATSGQYQCINTLTALEDLIEQLKTAGQFVFDCETTHLDFFRAELVGIAFSWQSGQASYVPLLHNAEYLAKLRPLLEDPSFKKGGHNIKYDLLVLRQHGIQVQGVAFDTMLEHYILDASLRTHNLDLLSLRYLQHQKIPIESLIGSGKQQITMAAVDVAKVTEYAGEDADCTWQLHEIFNQRLTADSLQDIYHNIELPILHILAEMEFEGIAIRSDYLQKLSTSMQERLYQLQQTIYENAGEVFNIQSTQQLAVILFEKLKLHLQRQVKLKKTKTGYSTDVTVLEALAPHPLIDALLEFRNISKLKSTYCDTLPLLADPKTGRIHTSFNQTVAATGRLSSSDPNLQNIPIRSELGRQIRQAFVPNYPDWCLVSADYSQIELRLLAHLSQDPALIEFFVNDLDIHSQTAMQLFKLKANEVDETSRSRAKAINFGILYGMGPQRLAKETGVSMSQAQAFIDNYFTTFPGVAAYSQRCIDFAKAHGYVETMLKRRRALTEIESQNPRLRAEAERMAVNTPIQGSAADLIKLAMIQLHQSLTASKLRAKLLLQVHDELVLCVPKNELEATRQLLINAMTQALPLKVPLKVEVHHGDNWLLAHP